MAENKNAPAGLEEIESHVPEQLHPILEAAFRNMKQIVIGVGAVVLVAAAYAGITTYNARAVDSATAELGRILIETSGEEKLAQLEGLLKDAPSAAKSAILVELADSCMTAGQYDKAAGYWDELAGNADGNLQIVARMGKAKALTMGGKAAEAVTILKDMAGTASDAYTVTVNRQLAVAAEQAGDTASALAAYRVLSEKGTTDKPFIDYKIAQLEAK